MDQARERQLIAEIVETKSMEAADELIRVWYDEMYVYALRRLGNKEDAMDATQEIFIGMLEGLASYDRERAGFRTWLYGVASHKVTDYRRKRYRSGAMPGGDGASGNEAGSDGARGAGASGCRKERLAGWEAADALNMLGGSGLAEPVAAVDVERLVENRFTLAQVDTFLRGQDPLTRQIFYLRIYEERNFDEIGMLTGEKEAKVKARFYRMLKKLKKEVARNDR